MNILPKKNWHVRTKDNVARVKRDEAKAAEEEKRAKERIQLAEQEFRTNRLKQKAADKRFQDGLVLRRETDDGDDSTVNIHSTDGHINFFADVEQEEKKTFGTNKEYEKEKKQEKEDAERKLGVLKYLGEGSAEYMKELPWWAKAPTREKPDNSHLEKKPAVNKSPNPSANSVLSSGMEVNPRLTCKRSHSETRKHEKRKHKKKHKKSKKRKSRASCESSGSEPEVSQSVIDGKSGLEKLREERITREAEERLKTEQLMRKMRGEPESAPVTKQKSDKSPVKQKYNSQFNPEWARQNRTTTL